MSEKYYVVSESELRQLKRAAAVEALVDSLRWGGRRTRSWVQFECSICLETCEVGTS